MDGEKSRILEEIGGILGKDVRIVDAVRAMKDENRRLKEAVAWAADEMRNGGNRWYETSQPGEKYYDWFARELFLRAGTEERKP